MSKLSVANLVHTVRALGDTKGAPHRSASLIGERLWRLTAGADSPDALIGVGDLSAAIREVFDADHDRVVFNPADAHWRVLGSSERLLRFDPEHHGHGSPDAIDFESDRFESDRFESAGAASDAMPADSARSSLIKGLGAVQARQMLGQQHWVVVVVNADAPSAELPLSQLQRLCRSQRLLILWCEEQTSAPRAGKPPAAAAFEQLSNQPDLICLGPIGGLGPEGVAAVLEALKAIEQPAVLYLRLRREAPPIESGGKQADLKDNDGSAPARSINGRSQSNRPVRGDLTSANGFHQSPSAAPRQRLAMHVAAEGLVRLAESDRRIVGLDLAGGAGWSACSDGGPQRFSEAGAEDIDLLAWCAGLAEGGCRPFVLLTEAALRRWYGRVAEEIDGLRRPVTFVVGSTHRDASSGAGGAGGLSLLSDTVLMVPSHAAELSQMLSCAARQPGPAAIWLPHTLSEGPIESSPEQVEVGRAVRLRSGADLALLTLGDAAIAIEAADELQRQGVEASVLSLRFARPLDREAIVAAVSEARAALVIDHDISFAAAAIGVLASQGVEKPLAVLGRGEMHDKDDPAGRRRRIEQLVGRGLKLFATSAPGLILATAESSFSGQSATAAQSPSSLGSAQEERDRIEALRFTPTVQAWIEEYSEVGERGLYLWRWCRHGVGLTTLPCVPDELRDDACDTKFLSGMLNVLLDDVSDQWRNGDLLDELLKVTAGSSADFGRFSPDERRYAELTCKLWNVFWQRVRQYPCHEVYRELLRYDLTQLFNTVRYSHLVNNNLSLLNVIEHDHYSSQGMGLMGFSTVDLMCSSRFPCQDLAALREVMWHAQWMARIGNLVTTWQREIGDGDYTSGVFARAVGRRELTVEQLRAGDAGEIEDAVRRGEHETYFLRRWNYHRDRLRLMRPRFEAFDLNLVIQGLERLLLTELGSRGRK
ncbi:MAG TPA: transketolase C-terminal domain-containing protein [Pirellulales bacterium]|jgi:transketolase C-terminal domain/subunit|nr:transketolase C-terminal domain-containing protein [Pirellulales bacterium]